MEKNENIGPHIVDYLLAGKAGDRDPALAAWLRESPENRALLDSYRKIWLMSNIYIDAEEFDTCSAWERIHELHRRKNRARARKRGLVRAAAGVAAAVVLLAAIYFALPGGGGIVGGEMALSTPFGTISEAVLPDGTAVTLAPGTQLDFRTDKKTGHRTVTFDGEGLFHVAPTGKPFVIRTPAGMAVRVTGTKFNLSAYSDDQAVRTTLLEGSVMLNTPGGSHGMVPGQTARFDPAAGTLRIEDDDMAELHAGWTENRIYMDGTPLREVCRKLERRYDVSISVSPEAAGLSYTGVIGEEGIDGILEALSMLSRLRYTIDGREITITL